MRLRHQCLIGFLTSALCAACGSSSSAGGAGAAGAAGAGEGAGGTLPNGGSAGTADGGAGTSGGGTSGGGTAGTADGGGGTSGGAGGNAGGSGGAATGAITTCIDATVFSGDPNYDADPPLAGWNPAGQAKTADPPLRNRRLAVHGQTVFYDTNYEIWRTDGNNVVRISGSETDNTADAKYIPTGTCAAARFINIQGIAMLPDGTLIVNDQTGGGLVALTNPTAAGCTASAYAGNQTVTDHQDVTDDMNNGNQGDVNGPGATAKFNFVNAPVAGPDGAVYIDDAANYKIKKIGADKAHTVTTLASYKPADPNDPDPTLTVMTVLNGKLYIAGQTSVSEFLWSVDTAGGAITTVYTGTGHFPEFDSSELANIQAMTNDGTSLFLGAAKGYIWKVDTTGKVVKTLAGMGQVVDFPKIDTTKPIPVDMLPLEPPAGTVGSLVILGSDLLWAGRGAQGLGFHVFDIRCQ